MTRQNNKYIILRTILTGRDFIINFLIKQHKIDILIIINQTEIFGYFILA